jgi:hypothetical protein
VKTSPARFVGHVRVKARDIGEESDDLEVVLSASPVYGKSTIEIHKVCELGICLWDTVSNTILKGAWREASDI